MRKSSLMRKASGSSTKGPKLITETVLIEEGYEVEVKFYYSPPVPWSREQPSEPYEYEIVEAIHVPSGKSLGQEFINLMQEELEKLLEDRRMVHEEEREDKMYGREIEY